MSIYEATYKHVPRNVFNTLSERIQKENINVALRYNGTNLAGDLAIEGCAGCGNDYKKALQMFNEEYCK